PAFHPYVPHVAVGAREYGVAAASDILACESVGIEQKVEFMPVNRFDGTEAESSFLVGSDLSKELVPVRVRPHPNVGNWLAVPGHHGARKISFGNDGFCLESLLVGQNFHHRQKKY